MYKIHSNVLTIIVRIYEGKILASETLNWGMRVRVVLEAAQGIVAMEYY